MFIVVKFVTDLHTHTIASGHAYNSMDEMAKAASDKGVELIAITDHAPALPGGAHEFYFINLKVVPEYIEGVRILRGCEINVINEKGELDLEHKYIRNLDYIIAAMHPPVFKPISSKVNTKAAVKVMHDSRIKALAHPDDVRYELDYDTLAKAAVDTNTYLEFNSHSIECGRGSKDTFKRMYEGVIKYGAKIVLGSDAHYKNRIADFDELWEMLEGFGEDGSNIVSLTPEDTLNALGIKV